MITLEQVTHGELDSRLELYADSEAGKRNQKFEAEEAD
jgi:hypothetical protein